MKRKPGSARLKRKASDTVSVPRKTLQTLAEHADRAMGEDAGDPIDALEYMRDALLALARYGKAKGKGDRMIHGH